MASAKSPSSTKCGCQRGPKQIITAGSQARKPTKLSAALANVVDCQPMMIENVRLETLDPIPESEEKVGGASRRRHFSYRKASLHGKAWKNQYWTYH